MRIYGIVDDVFEKKIKRRNSILFLQSIKYKKIQSGSSRNKKAHMIEAVELSKRTQREKRKHKV
jgi:hypothetical protein